MKYFISFLFIAFSNFCFGQNSEFNDTENGIIYFSSDNGTTWENRSAGFPDNTFMTDIAVSGDLLGITTKQNGIFLYNFQKNIWEKVPTIPTTNYTLDGMFFFNNKIYAGSQNGGIFVSGDLGKTWHQNNDGLGNLTIRKFGSFHNKLYAGTNGGLYSLNEPENKWILEFGNNSLQVNGITEFENELYIGTNQGAFKSSTMKNSWKQIMSDCALHNISSDDHAVYAMVYNELFSSTDKGNTWQSLQKGLPEKLYTFQVMKNGDVILAGQWDGVYKTRDSGAPLYLYSEWEFSGKGLPSKFAVTEMKIYKNMIVIGCSERGLKRGYKINEQTKKN